MIFNRRLTFGIIVLASQSLLIALAITWLIQMLVIAEHGSVYFIENNPAILMTEIILSALICVFSIVVFALQLVKLGERRQTDRSRPR